MTETLSPTISAISVEMPATEGTNPSISESVETPYVIEAAVSSTPSEFTLSSLPKVGEFTDFYGGVLKPADTSFFHAPDVAAQNMAPGEFPTPHEAVLAVQSLLGINDEINSSDYAETQRILEGVEELLDTAYEHMRQPMVENQLLTKEYALLESTKDIVAEESLEQIELPDVSSAETSQPDMLKTAVVQLVAETTSIAETVQTLREMGHKNPEDVVGKIVAEKLETLGVSASVAIEIDPFSAISTTNVELAEHEDDCVVRFTLEPDEVTISEKFDEMAVEDEYALNNRVDAFENAAKDATEEKEEQQKNTSGDTQQKKQVEIDGIAVVRKHTKTQQEISQPLRNTFLPDGSLEEVLHDVATLEEQKESEIKMKISEINKDKPPVRFTDDGKGTPVTAEDVERVFNGEMTLPLVIEVRIPKQPAQEIPLDQKEQ